MNTLSPSSLFTATEIFNACNHGQKFLDDNKLAICSQKYIYTSLHHCFSSYPSNYTHLSSLYIRHWERDDFGFNSHLSQEPYYVAKQNLLLLPESETAIDYLVLIIGKVALKYFNQSAHRDFITYTQMLEAGQLSLADYELWRFSQSYDSAQGLKNLAQNCSSLWGTNFSNPKALHAKIANLFPTTKGALMVSTYAQQGVNVVRSNWEQNYKNQYCQAHPRDDYSCKNLTALYPNYPNPSSLSRDLVAWVQHIHDHPYLFPRKVITEIFDYYYNGSSVSYIDEAQSEDANQRLMRISRSLGHVFQEGL